MHSATLATCSFSATHTPGGRRDTFHVGSSVDELIMFLQYAPCTRHAGRKNENWQPYTKHAGRKKEKRKLATVHQARWPEKRNMDPGHQHRSKGARRLSCNDHAKTMRRPAHAGQRAPEPRNAQSAGLRAAPPLPAAALLRRDALPWNGRAHAQRGSPRLRMHDVDPRGNVRRCSD